MESNGLFTQCSVTFIAPCRRVRHVAVGARDAAPRVDALAPHLELRMLGLEHLDAGLRVRPVVEAVPLQLHPS